MVSVKAELRHNVFGAGKPTFFDAVRRRFYIFGLDIVDYSPSHTRCSSIPPVPIRYARR